MESDEEFAEGEFSTVIDDAVDALNEMYDMVDDNEILAAATRFNELTEYMERIRKHMSNLLEKYHG